MEGNYRNAESAGCEYYERDGWDAECDHMDGTEGFNAREMCCACGGGKYLNISEIEAGCKEQFTALKNDNN